MHRGVSEATAVIGNHKFGCDAEIIPNFSKKAEPPAGMAPQWRLFQALRATPIQSNHRRHADPNPVSKPSEHLARLGRDREGIAFPRKPEREGRYPPRDSVSFRAGAAIVDDPGDDAARTIIVARDGQARWLDAIGSLGPANHIPGFSAENLFPRSPHTIMLDPRRKGTAHIRKRLRRIA